jgi:hypothetical protein
MKKNSVKTLKYIFYFYKLKICYIELNLNWNIFNIQLIVTNIYIKYT